MSRAMTLCVVNVRHTGVACLGMLKAGSRYPVFQSPGFRIAPDRRVRNDDKGCRRMTGFNRHGVWAIYQSELARGYLRQPGERARMSTLFAAVMPANTGIQSLFKKYWIPAVAGMTT